MERNPNTNPARATDPLSQVLRVTECNKVDFLLENRTYENLLKAVPPFAPVCTLFSDTDPWEVTVWTHDRPEDIKATLVEIRELLVPAGYKDMGMPRHLGALAYTRINSEPAFPELAVAMETIRRVSDPAFWKPQQERAEPETVPA